MWGGKGMLILGIILLLVASVIRAFGAMGRQGVASESIIAILSIVSIILAIIAAFIIAAATSLWVGILSFVAFWVLSGIWIPIISSIGM